jgi:hypothetical protein
VNLNFIYLRDFPLLPFIHNKSFETIPMTGPAPLPVIPASVIQAFRSASPCSLARCQGVFRLLVAYSIPIEAAVSCLHALLGPTQSLDDIMEILASDSRPLPPRDQSKIPRFDNWSKEEDTRLLSGICRFGLKAWNLIATFVGSSRTTLDPKSRSPIIQICMD